MKILQTLLCLLLAGSAIGKPSTTIYAQELVNRMTASHPEITVLAMHVTPPKSGDNVRVGIEVMVYEPENA